MRAFKRKVRPRFVVELGSRPSAGGMTGGTIHTPQALELASMNILVTTLALV